MSEGNQNDLVDVVLREFNLGKFNLGKYIYDILHTLGRL